MKIGIYSLYDNRFNFSAISQMNSLANALQKDNDVHRYNIIGKRKNDDINIFFPFHYWHENTHMRLQDVDGKYYTPPLKPFQENDILIGIADSSEFDEETLKMVKQQPYAYFNAVSTDTANVMNLPRTEVIPHCIPDAVMKTTPYEHNEIPNVYINETNFFFRRGTDVAIAVLSKLAEQYDFTVTIKTNRYLAYPKMDKGKITTYSHKKRVEDHYDMMNKADIFFAPVRGGAFEVPILEMLALGKTVVLPDRGGWTDIPLTDDVYYFNAGKRNCPLYDYTDRAYHKGYQFSLDIKDAYRQMERALQKYKKVDVDSYRKEYSPQRYADKLLTAFDKYHGS